MAYVVALTGGIGSGKTAVSDLLEKLGAAVVDTDVIARELTATGGAAMPAIVATFGAGIAAADGSMDRAKMRALAFADPGAKHRLEAILHPLIRTQAFERVSAAAAPYVVLVVPLLLETNAYGEIIDRTLVVDCPESIQIERTMRRSGLARAEVERILNAQTSRTARLEAADDVIVNDAGLDTLAAAVEKLHARYLAAAQEKSKRAQAPD